MRNSSHLYRASVSDAAFSRRLATWRPGDLVVLIVGKSFRDLGRMVGEFGAQRADHSAA